MSIYLRYSILYTVESYLPLFLDTKAYNVYTVQCTEHIPILNDENFVHGVKKNYNLKKKNSKFVHLCKLLCT